MIEETIINYLISKDLSVRYHVYPEVPENPPETYLVIEKTGSGRTNRINRAMIAIQSVARKDRGKSLLDAMKLNEEVLQAMDEIIELPDISRCELNSDYNFTNTQTREYRYQAVFNLYY